MTIVRFGQSARVKNGKTEWTNEDFALAFLGWLVETYPTYRDGWVCMPDIEKHLFPRFKARARCRHLQLGSLQRGLGNVTKKRDVAYADATGRRRTMVEYWVAEG